MNHQNTKTQVDFLQYLDKDVSVYIMSWLDDPADLVRASLVSRFWHHFVISNELAKNLCTTRCPQLSNGVEISVANDDLMHSLEISGNIDIDQKMLRKDHEAYTTLLHVVTKSKLTPDGCIQQPISASSTNHPDESIGNTLIEKHISGRVSYWSSKGHNNPHVAETLIYKLGAGTRVITEVDIQPYQELLQPDNPIYSAMFVRIRVGHPKSSKEIEEYCRYLPSETLADNKFIWTYTSPEFPMIQENSLQRFELEEPVLSMDGYMQIELLGGVQRQESDGLFYIRLNYVEVLGRRLYPAFYIKILEPNGKLVVSYTRKHLRFVTSDYMPSLCLEDDGAILWAHSWHRIQHGPTYRLDGFDEDDDVIN